MLYPKTNAFRDVYSLNGVWNFADFKTKQGLTRIRGNRKGVFTKERQPKMIAHYLKNRWKDKQ